MGRQRTAPGAGPPSAAPEAGPSSAAPEVGPSAPGGASAAASPAGAAPQAAAGPRHHGDPWKAAFFVFAMVAIIAGVAWALLGSSLLVVRSVQVTGVHLVTRAEVLSAAGIQRGTPLIRINTRAVAGRVEQLTQVQSAQVSRDWPDQVLISVQERTPALAVARAGVFELIDKFGVVVRQSTARPAGMPLLAIPAAGSLSTLRGSPAVRAAVSVLQQLPPRLSGLVRSVSAQPASTVTLRLSGGITVVWGGTDRPAAKARELVILMRSRARYYDVSDPGTVVTRGGP